MLSVLGLAFGFVGAQIIYMALAIGIKWHMIGRTIPGRYHARSEYALRVNLVQNILSAPLARCFCTLFAESSLMNLVVKSLGGKLNGRNVIFKVLPKMLIGVDQVTLGESASLGHNAAIMGAALVGQDLLIAPVVVGAQ